MNATHEPLQLGQKSSLLHTNFTQAVFKQHFNCVIFNKLLHFYCPATDSTTL